SVPGKIAKTRRRVVQSLIRTMRLLGPMRSAVLSQTDHSLRLRTFNRVNKLMNIVPPLLFRLHAVLKPFPADP
ncbi:hypothetical protein SB783_47015, partial [Paraburkholderia sp. SIMBA_009]